MRRLVRSLRSVRGPGLLLPTLLIASCGERAPEVMMPIETVVASLIDDEAAREVLLENEAGPVEAGTYAPSSAFRHDSSPLPALRLVPPARVRVNLSPLPEGAQLRFGVGFDQAAYEGKDRGKVRFRLGDGSRWLFEEEVPFGKEVKQPARRWHLEEIELSGVESLLLETEVVAGAGAPPAAFTSLQVVTHAERPRERPDRDRPNVILIVLDTLRYDRLSCYGGRDGLTPTLDALAERGVLFESAYASSSWTWPSTASILTSLTTAEHGLESHRACYLSQSLLTLGEALQMAGWTTGAISANPLVHSDKEFDQGFETFEDHQWRRAELITDHAIDWLRENSEWRHFLFLQYVDPHEYKPEVEFRERWAGKPPKGYRKAEWRELYTQMLADEEYDAARLAAYTEYMSTLYDASLAEFDAALARLIDAVEASGQLENTLIVFTSDHGEEFFEHGTLYHGNHLHRELVGVPLIIAGPGIPSGARITERVENRFLAPTILSRVGLERLDNLQGPDLLDVAQVRDGAREPMFLSTRRGVWLEPEGPALPRLAMHGVQLGDDLFLWVPETEDGSPRRALFDLAADPEALHDLSTGFPDRCERYEGMIERWLERSAATRPNVLDGGESALQMMLDLGYVDIDR